MGRREFIQEPRGMTPYFINHLPHHLIATNNSRELQSLLDDHWFCDHSPVFYRENFYADIVALLSAPNAVTALAHVHRFFAGQAAAKSPISLGYSLFPHEPGVNFVNGTPADGYMIPPGAVEPPSKVLWDYIKACGSLFIASAAFLRSALDPVVVKWYQDFWKQFGLQQTLDDIERYYDTHHPHLSFRAMELSWQIDEALKKVQAN